MAVKNYLVSQCQRLNTVFTTKLLRVEAIVATAVGGLLQTLLISKTCTHANSPLTPAALEPGNQSTSNLPAVREKWFLKQCLKPTFSPYDPAVGRRSPKSTAEIKRESRKAEKMLFWVTTVQWPQQNPQCLQIPCDSTGPATRQGDKCKRIPAIS